MFSNKFVIIAVIILVVSLSSAILWKVLKYTSSRVVTNSPAIQNIEPAPIPRVLDVEIATSTVLATSSPVLPNIPGKYIFNLNQDPGSRSDEVVKLQERLIKDGYFNGLNGGFFGPATEQALKVYQKAKGLPETGKLDVITRNKLNAQ